MVPITNLKCLLSLTESHKAEAQLGTKPWESQVYILGLSCKKHNFCFL